MSFGVKLGGLVPTVVPTIADLPGLAVEVEAMGAADVVHGEHLLFGAGMHHPGGHGAHLRAERQSDVADVLILFTAIAARTTTLRLAPGFLLGAAHNFAVLAKQAATLDVLSRGRLDLGLGSGWYAGEFEAMGIPFEQRYARMEETARACRELWSSSVATFSGEYIRFERMTCEPAPFTPGGPPVWWGGAATKAVIRRVVRVGEGWIASQTASEDEVRKGIDLLAAECELNGRSTDDIGVRATLPLLPEGVSELPAVIDHAVGAAARFAKVGVTHVTVPVDLYGIDIDGTGELLAALRKEVS